MGLISSGTVVSFSLLESVLADRLLFSSADLFFGLEPVVELRAWFRGVIFRSGVPLLAQMQAWDHLRRSSYHRRCPIGRVLGVLRRRSNFFTDSRFRFVRPL